MPGVLGAIWAPTIILGDSAHLAADVGLDVILTVVALALARGRHGPMRSRPRGRGVGSATSAPRSLRGRPWLIDLQVRLTAPAAPRPCRRAAQGSTNSHEQELDGRYSHYDSTHDQRSSAELG